MHTIERKLSKLIEAERNSGNRNLDRQTHLKFVKYSE